MSFPVVLFVGNFTLAAFCSLLRRWMERRRLQKLEALILSLAYSVQRHTAPDYFKL